MADLAELLARVEAAEGPDTSIDWDIEEAFGDWENLGGALKRHKVTRETRTGYIEPKGAYTASLDAALALVERLGLDGLTIMNEAVELMGVSGWSTARPLGEQLARYVLIVALLDLIARAGA